MNMLKFPDNFGRRKCVELLTNYQTDLLGTTRRLFYDLIIDAIKQCESCIQLKLPNNMWDLNKRILATELLERFEYIDVQYIHNNCDVSRRVDTVDYIPNNITFIFIVFEHVKN